jgi:hypothetical protein
MIPIKTAAELSSQTISIRTESELSNMTIHIRTSYLLPIQNFPIKTAAELSKQTIFLSEQQQNHFYEDCSRAFKPPTPYKTLHIKAATQLVNYIIPIKPQHSLQPRPSLSNLHPSFQTQLFLSLQHALKPDHQVCSRALKPDHHYQDLIRPFKHYSKIAFKLDHPYQNFRFTFKPDHPYHDCIRAFK